MSKRCRRLPRRRAACRPRLTGLTGFAGLPDWTLKAERRLPVPAGRGVASSRPRPPPLSCSRPNAPPRPRRFAPPRPPPSSPCFQRRFCTARWAAALTLSVTSRGPRGRSAPRGAKNGGGEAPDPPRPWDPPPPCTEAFPKGSCRPTATSGQGSTDTHALYVPVEVACRGVPRPTRTPPWPRRRRVARPG